MLVRCYSLELPKSMKSIESQATDVISPRICVIFPGALGDFICFMPALETLRHVAFVDLFARGEFAELVPDGIRISSLESPCISRLFRSAPDEDDDDRRFFDAYDEVYSWHGSGNREFVQRLKSLAGCRAHIFRFRPVHALMHQADYYFGCLGHCSAGPEQPAILFRPGAVRWCENFWIEHALHGRAILTIAPGSGAREKNWPKEFFLEVIQWWCKATGGRVLLLSGPVEQERGGIEQLTSACTVASGLSLSQAAALLAHSDLYLGNDSGISHLAAASGVRTVALFGPSDAHQWSPRGKKVTVLRRGVGCSPCGEPTMKSCPHRVCLTEFHPQQIIYELAQLPEVVTLTRLRAGITV
jgi:glycosyl transferase family 9 (putative heptosyltransferase)